MAQNNFLSFLNSLDRGANDRNSITEFLANILTPGDNMEYVGGQLLGADGKRPENFGEKTSYGTLGQANFEGNDRVKRGLLSKMTSGMSDMNKVRPDALDLPGKSYSPNMRPDALDMPSTSYSPNMRPDALDMPMTSYAPNMRPDALDIAPIDYSPRTRPDALNLPVTSYSPNMRPDALDMPGTSYSPNMRPDALDIAGTSYSPNMRPDALDIAGTSSDPAFDKFFEKITGDSFYLPILDAMTAGREGSAKENLKYFYYNTDPQVLTELGLM
jgi:hypothetical protein